MWLFLFARTFVHWVHNLYSIVHTSQVVVPGNLVTSFLLFTFHWPNWPNTSSTLLARQVHQSYWHIDNASTRWCQHFEAWVNASFGCVIPSLLKCLLMQSTGYEFLLRFIKCILHCFTQGVKKTRLYLLWHQLLDNFKIQHDPAWAVFAKHALFWLCLHRTTGGTWQFATIRWSILAISRQRNCSVVNWCRFMVPLKKYNSMS